MLKNKVKDSETGICIGTLVNGKYKITKEFATSS